MCVPEPLEPYTVRVMVVSGGVCARLGGGVQGGEKLVARKNFSREWGSVCMSIASVGDLFVRIFV